MKNGHLYSLGFMSYCSHDPAACLIRLQPNGQLDYIHFEEGMLSRRKKSYQFALRAIQACLDHYGITLNEVDVVALDFMNSRSVHNTASYYRKLVGDYIRAKLRLREDQIHFADSHHLAHAYTAFYPSGFENAAVLAIDGLGSEQNTHTIFLANLAAGIQKVYSQKGTGIGQLYSLITERLGFEDGEEGKTMGLAPYGEVYTGEDRSLPDLGGTYQGYCVDYSHLMQRQPTPRLRVNIEKCPSKSDVYSPRYARLAYKVQQELECCLLHLSREIHARTGARRLCIAGGVGLNCVANEIIRRSGIFEEVFVQPSSGDSGVALGLAMVGIEEAARRSGNRGVDWRSSQEAFWTYAPIKFDNSELRNILAVQNVSWYPAETRAVAQSLTEGHIVAYYEAGWEFGPRALGHRSFLADPRSPEMKAILNSKIKHRELYRPFAPIMLAEHFTDYFDSPVTWHPHMLYAVRCRERAKHDAQTIVHVDDTARVQTCSPEAGRIYDVIAEFHKLTGVPILVNTSLNDNDEPIVMTPIDALSCFLRTSADILVVDDIMVRRNEICSIDVLLATAEAYQSEQLRKYTDRALRNLLDFSTGVEDMNSFLTRNLLSSLYARFNESADCLARALFAEESPGDFVCLITDVYHLDIIRRMATHYKKPIPFPETVLLDDQWTSLGSIPENSYVLLYNLSVCMRDAEACTAYPALSTCSSFYHSNDRLVLMHGKDTSLDELVAQVMDTYEVNTSRNIGDLFSGVIAQEFMRIYL
ncbi:MAG: Decarbamoylnovobiocin carbamoyltransferase [Nitrosomonadaceae bacterium]|nr:Decarbamoylnovobiocin carbamoyltransferase [Nitrosomonadaceae bacterium]